ncbi:hypothetical protein ScPMuIL_000069 [Solemya velum]
MKKLLDRGSRKKQWYNTPALSESQSSSGIKNTISEGQRRRAKQVGRVMYDYITEHVTSGELDPKLCTLALEISKVKIAPDFSAVNVYWVAEGTERDVDIQSILNENSGRLRHLLSTYRVIGRIPPIHFVKDMTESKYKEIVELLKEVDLGPDFQPTDDKMEPSLDTDVQNLAEENIQKDFVNVGIKNTDANNAMDVVEDEKKETRHERGREMPKTLPTRENDTCDTFRQNIFGLDHAALIKKITVSKQKSKSRSTKEAEDTHFFISETERMVGQMPVDYTKLIKKNWKSKIKIGKTDYTVKDYLKCYGESSEFDNSDQYKYEADDDGKVN